MDKTISELRDYFARILKQAFGRSAIKMDDLDIPDDRAQADVVRVGSVPQALQLYVEVVLSF